MFKCANVRHVKVIVPTVNLNWSLYGYVFVWYAVLPTPNVKSCQSPENREIGLKLIVEIKIINSGFFLFPF